MNSPDMIVVSGAGTGIGRAAARRLVADGFHVLAVGCRVPDDVTSGKALMQAIAGQVIARGTLTGTYER